MGTRLPINVGLQEPPPLFIGWCWGQAVLEAALHWYVMEENCSILGVCVFILLLGGYGGYMVFSTWPFFVAALCAVWKNLNSSPREITKFSLI